MENAIYNNAFGILGLLPNATQKEIAKKGKDIPKYIKIDEPPHYDYDFGIYFNKRNENSVKDALQELSNIQDHIIHYFFRVYPVSEKEVDTLCKINTAFEDGTQSQDFIAYIENASSKSFLAKKNNIVIRLILLHNKMTKAKSKLLAKKLIAEMKEFIDTSKTWADFKKLYKADDELGVNETIINDAKNFITESFIKILSDISDLQSNPDIAKELTKVFGGDDAIGSVRAIDTIIENIDNAIKQLDKIAEKLTSTSNKKVKNLLEIIQDEFNNLIEFGVYDNYEIQEIRDRFCKCLIGISVSYNNDNKDFCIAGGLINVGLEVYGSDIMKLELEKASAQIEENILVDTNGLGTCRINYSNITFFADRLELGNRIFPIEQIEGVSYSLMNQSGTFTTSVYIDFALKCNGRLYKFSENATWGERKSELQKEFGKFFYLSKNILEPHIIAGMIKKMQNGESIKIGDVEFNKLGVHKYSWFGDKHLYWKDIKYIPVISNGLSIIIDNSKDIFYSTPLDVMNACLFEDLVKACIESFRNV